MSQDTKKTAAAKAAEEKAKAKAEADALAAAAQAKAEDEAAAVAAAATDSQTESEVSDAQEKPAPEREAEIETVQETEKDKAPQSVFTQNGSVLKAVAAWVGEKRIATWQSAALLRAKGWTDDKKVTENDFNKALAAAMSRPQGGANGRRN